MNAILFIGVLFMLSLAVNTVITRWSTKRVLGIDVSYFNSGIAVTGRSLPGLLAGFALGYAVRIGLQGDAATIDGALQIGAMVIISIFSFLVYWVLLGKLTGKEISLWGITKTAATETVVMIGSVFVIGIVLSVTFYFFNPSFWGGVT